MINYPVDVNNTRWAVMQLSTGEIISRNKSWPVADGSEIQGADPDYVYLKHVTSPQPDYDARLYTLQGTETVDEPNNQITKTWAANKRPVEEQILAAENVEAERLQEQISLPNENLETRLVIAALIEYAVDAKDFPPKARAMIDKYKSKGKQLWKNRDRLDKIKEDIAQDKEPDLDNGWADIE